MNIGEKLLEIPKTIEDMLSIIKLFGFKRDSEYTSNTIDNARRLVQINNEVYEKLHECESK